MVRIITEPAVAPFEISCAHLNLALERMDRQRFFPILMVVNGLYDQPDAPLVRREIIALLEELRALAREKLDGELRDTFIAWSVWPCNAAYSEHLMLGEDRFRWIAE